MITSETDGMDVGLARVVGSAQQDLGINDNIMWIPLQALEQFIKCRMTNLFISGHQGWEFWPEYAILSQPPYWKNNLNTQKIMTSYVFYYYLLFFLLLIIKIRFGKKYEYKLSRYGIWSQPMRKLSEI